MDSIREFYESGGYSKDYSFSDFKDIVSSPFKFLRESTNEFKEVRFELFGVFLPSHGRFDKYIERCKKLLEEAKEKGDDYKIGLYSGIIERSKEVKFKKRCRKKQE